MKEKQWKEVTGECELRWWHMEEGGSVVEMTHTNGVVALLSFAGGNLTTSSRIREHYKIEQNDDFGKDIPTKWFKVYWDGEVRAPHARPRQDNQ